MLSKRLIFFALALALTGLLFQFTPDSSPNEDSTTQLEQADWLIYQSETWRVDRNNPEQQHYLKADISRQQGDTLYLTAPIFVITKPNESLRVSAEHAEIRHENEFYFIGEGEVLRQDKDQKQSLLADRFLYQLDTQRLTSREAVTLTGERYITQGKGLIMQLDTHQLELLSEVKTRYVP